MSIVPYNTGNLAKYRFYLTYNTITYEVFPANFLDSSVIDEFEEDHVFHRQKFNGTLLFGGQGKEIDVSGVEQSRTDDFTLLWAIESADPCARLDLTITKTVSGVVTTYWEGYFSTTDGIIDVDKCTFEVTPLTDDKYTSILEKADIEYNILSIATVVTTHAVRVSSTNYTRNRWLMDVIEYLGVHATYGVSPGSTISSTFFTAATNPATEKNNELLYVTIAQKSDIIYPTSSDPATVALLSWNYLMEILWAMFQVTWDYDADTDTINVEHISYFTTTGSLDIRTQLSTKSTNKYRYIKPKMPKYERFAFMEADEINFVGTYIYYPSLCVNNDTYANAKETNIRVTTDIEFIHDSPEAIDYDGFVLMCNYESGGQYYVVVSTGDLYSLNARLNMPFSWANLHDKYYRHNRVDIEGYLNNNLITFYSAMKTKLQECFINYCDDFDSRNAIVTELGETYLGGVSGVVNRAEISPSGMIKLELLYGPPDNPITPIVTKIANFVQTSEQTVEVWLSSPSDANYSLHIYEEMYDGDCNLLCSEGQPADPETFVINIGETYATFTFTDTCTPHQAGYTFWVQIDDATMLANGWTVYFERDYDYIIPGCPS